MSTRVPTSHGGSRAAARASGLCSPGLKPKAATPLHPLSIHVRLGDGWTEGTGVAGQLVVVARVPIVIESFEETWAPGHDRTHLSLDLGRQQYLTAKDA
jgi:hypothetical protein